jgi:hypothetical protein
LQQSRASAIRRLFRPTQDAASHKRLWERVMRHKLTGTFRELLRIFAHPFDPYRPELHYMRGPGPKYQAKRVESTESAAPATGENVRVRRAAAQAHA